MNKPIYLYLDPNFGTVWERYNEGNIDHNALSFLVRYKKIWYVTGTKGHLKILNHYL
jgi:hypothetical protein